MLGVVSYHQKPNRNEKNRDILYLHVLLLYRHVVFVGMYEYPFL